SFDELSVNLDRFNVLVGANASGKSNFVQIFRFLRDIANHGLENAIALQGDVRYFRNVNLPLTRDFYLSTHAVFNYTNVSTPIIRSVKRRVGMRPDSMDYSLKIRFKRKGSSFGVVEEVLSVDYSFMVLDIHGDGFDVKTEEKGKVTIFIKNGRTDFQVVLPENIPLKESDILPAYWKRQKFPDHISLIEAFLNVPGSYFKKLFTDIHIYDFDPKAMRRTALISSMKKLEEDGSNIALVLKDLLENKVKKHQFLSLIQDLLPFIQDLKIAKYPDKSLHFSTQEKYTDQYLPGFLLSDGTVILTALVYVLFFSTPNIIGEIPLVILEEPAQHIHPSLISRMLQLIEEASQSQQILITTHNPEIVKHTPLDRLLLISRDERGFSTIKRPVEKQEVKTFLENEIGIEELFLQNLLE
ncbi:MAG: ATP-binding protein, partial [Calditrichaeota bacterium]